MMAEMHQWTSVQIDGVRGGCIGEVGCMGKGVWVRWGIGEVGCMHGWGGVEGRWGVWVRWDRGEVRCMGGVE